MVREGLDLYKILTPEAFYNSIKINAAVGGSTNFIVHLLAIAGRVGVELELNDFDELAAELPLLVNLMPSGKYLMEDFYYAGGVPAVIREMLPHLNNESLTVNGSTIKENNIDAPCYDRDVIYPLDQPLIENAGIAVLRGNLCPGGAIIKPSAATSKLMKHRGRAVVFETIEDYHARIDNPDLEIDENSIMVLKNVGPVGYPGMAEVGNMGLPKKLLERGVRDMVRISDGRMSGTAFGTVVLHVAPEAAVGGCLALVREGDSIELDVSKRRLNLDVSEEELSLRLAQWQAPEPHDHRGYVNLYTNHVLQADQGVDFDFLVGGSGSVVKREAH